ncbi:hypothetical protein B0H14DRAFT_3456672 [Mycena olivaceomarginata]|nr:hypothetical protein B0H14DRAFT_3456672 [Mycena olivaceomarginata]
MRFTSAATERVIAAAEAIFRQLDPAENVTTLEFETLSGTLTAHRVGEQIMMELPAGTTVPASTNESSEVYWRPCEMPRWLNTGEYVRGYKKWMANNKRERKEPLEWLQREKDTDAAEEVNISRIKFRLQYNQEQSPLFYGEIQVLGAGERQTEGEKHMVYWDKNFNQ